MPSGVPVVPSSVCDTTSKLFGTLLYFFRTNHQTNDSSTIAIKLLNNSSLRHQWVQWCNRMMKFKILVGKNNDNLVLLPGPCLNGICCRYNEDTRCMTLLLLWRVIRKYDIKPVGKILTFDIIGSHQPIACMIRYISMH